MDPPSYEFSTLRPPGEIEGENSTSKPESSPDQLETSFGSQSGLLSPTVIDATHDFGGRSVPASPRLSRAAHSEYQPRNPGYAPPEPSVWHTGQATTVVVNQPPPSRGATTLNPHRPSPVNLVQADHPVPVTCFNCSDDVITYIYFETGKVTYVACFGLAIIGCSFGCCFLPFCMDCSKDIIHKCPKCHVVLGHYKRL